MEAIKERTKQVYGRIDEALYERIRLRAVEHRRSIAAEVSLLLEMAMEKKGARP